MQRFKRNGKQKILLFPTDGSPIPQEKIPDEAFSTGILGTGFAVFPESGTVYSPLSGQVESVADARHAYTLIGDDGVELLVHVGIDTVELKGEGFLSMVSEGDRVRAGEVLARVDLSLLKEKGLHPHVVVMITNPDGIQELQLCTERGLGGKSEAAVYRTATNKKE